MGMTDSQQRATKHSIIDLSELRSGKILLEGPTIALPGNQPERKPCVWATKKTWWVNASVKLNPIRLRISVENANPVVFSEGLLGDD